MRVFRAKLANRDNPSAVPDTADAQRILAEMKRAESLQWWLWASAIVVTMLLTTGLLSFAVPFLFDTTKDFPYILNLKQSLRGLVGLVILFDCYAIYQQLQIYRVRRQLIESQKLFHLIGENVEDLIAVVDASGNRLYNSPSYERILGFSPKELQRTSGLEQIHPEDRARVMEAAWEAKRTGVGRRLEYRFKHKDGTWRVLESTASAVPDAKGGIKHLVIVNRDITERKKSEEMLRLKEEQFRQSQMETVGRLSGGIAHDFNNLLGVIIGYSDILEMKLDENDSLRKYVAEIKKAGTRASSLTQQLLAFSRQQVLQPKILELNAVVTDLAEMVRRLIGERIQVDIVQDPALGRVKADQSQVEQAIMNLVVNARDAMPEGGKLTIQTANVELDDEAVARHPYIKWGSYVQLTVSDSGMGMDPATLAHIFEPFFTTKEKGQGTGLRLAMVYGVVKQSDGYIWADSKLGAGTTFRICLPRAAQGVLAPALEESPAARSARGSETVLLVDDEDSLRTLISDLLAQEGYKVLAASCGAQALEIVSSYQGTIHLLLTDIVMPGIGGIALAKKLTASRPDMKILLMSGYIAFQSEGYDNLPTDTPILQKPFSNDTLFREVDKALCVSELQECSSV